MEYVLCAVIVLTIMVLSLAIYIKPKTSPYQEVPSHASHRAPVTSEVLEY